MKQAVDSFLNHLVVEKGFSTNTLEAYKNDLYQFVEFAQGRDHIQGETWGKVDLALLTDYVSSLRGRKELPRHHYRQEGGGAEVFLQLHGPGGSD